jgi:ATP-binding cassette subfamily B protein
MAYHAAVSGEDNSDAGFISRAVGVFGYSRRALDLVWTTSRTLTFTLAILTLVAGILPAAIAYVGQLIVDGVVAAMSAVSPDTRRVLWLVALEAVIVRGGCDVSGLAGYAPGAVAGCA